MVTSTVYNVSQEPLVVTPVNPQHDHVSTAVYVTSNYAQFKLDTRNRPINPAKLERLYDSINERNLLADNPILVTLGFSVLDGQHRLKAAESLGVPIYYQFASDTTIDDVPLLNNRRAGWRSADYLSAWCERGNEDYIRLRDFTKRYPWLPIKYAAELCSYGDKSTLTQDFVDGRYECNDVEFGDKVAQALLDFKAIGFSHWRSRIFIYAVRALVSNSDYDHSLMLKRLRTNSRKLRPAVDTDAYFEMFDEIYNFKARGNAMELRKLHVNDPRYRADRKAKAA